VIEGVNLTITCVKYHGKNPLKKSIHTFEMRDRKVKQILPGGGTSGKGKGDQRG
jgi:hypothetical protein